MKTFDDISHHSKLEDEQLEATRISYQAYLTKNSRFVLSFKKKKGFHINKSKDKKNFNIKPRHDKKMKCCGKCGNKKNMSMVKCFNGQKFGHFVKYYNESKRVHDMEKVYTFSGLNYYSFVSTFALTIDFFLSQIVDSRATNHVTCNRCTFIRS